MKNNAYYCLLLSTIKFSSISPNSISELRIHFFMKTIAIEPKNIKKLIVYNYTIGIPYPAMNCSVGPVCHVSNTSSPSR